VRYKCKNRTNKNNKLGNVIMMIEWYEHNGKCTKKKDEQFWLAPFDIVCCWDVEMLLVLAVSSRKNVNDLRKMEEDGDRWQSNPILMLEQDQVLVEFLGLDGRAWWWVTVLVLKLRCH